MSAQLTPIFPSDLVSPGLIYFARLDPQRSSDINAWWLVLRCAERLLPQSFLSSKDPQSRAFPFWIIGRHQFIWLSRDALFLLHPSQKSAFERTGFHNNFAHYYELATGPARSDPLAFFQQEIENARNHHSSRGTAKITELSGHSRVPSTESERPEEEEASLNAIPNQPIHDPPDGEVVETLHHKRRKADPRNSSRAMVIAVQGVDVADVNEIVETGSVRKNSPRVKIKTEAEENQHRYARAFHATDRVRIFIGTRQFLTSRKAIGKSPVLSSYIQRDEIGMFIMHPRLNHTEVPDFLSVLDFMQRSEISPKVADHTADNRNDSGGGRRRPSGPLALEGKHTSADYSAELIRAGRLYLLGKMFQITELNPYLVHRITTTEYRAYQPSAVIALARIIFANSGIHRAGFLPQPVSVPAGPGIGPGVVPATHRFSQGSNGNSSDIYLASYRHSLHSNNVNNSNSTGNDNHITKTEPMEQWIIKTLAENFREIMQVSSDRDLFWQMEKETVARQVVAEVYSRCAENYRAVGGIPVKID